MSERVLVIAPHCDDETLGMGGTLAQMVKDGYDVSVVIVSAGKSKRLKDKRYRIREQELVNAMIELGVSNYSILFPGYDAKMHKIGYSKLITAIDNLVETFRPDELYFPYSSNHQDHRFVFECCMASIRMKAGWNVPFIALYEYPFINTNFDAIHGGRYYRNITRTIKEKLKAFECYESQIKKHPSPSNPKGMMALASARGSECGIAYAEMFYIVRMLKV